MLSYASVRSGLKLRCKIDWQTNVIEIGWGEAEKMTVKYHPVMPPAVCQDLFSNLTHTRIAMPVY